MLSGVPSLGFLCLLGMVLAPAGALSADDPADDPCARFIWPNYPARCLSVDDPKPVVVSGRSITPGDPVGQRMPLTKAGRGETLRPSPSASESFPAWEEGGDNEAIPVASDLSATLPRSNPPSDASDSVDYATVVVLRAGRATAYRVPRER